MTALVTMPAHLSHINCEFFTQAVSEHPDNLKDPLFQFVYALEAAGSDLVSLPSDPDESVLLIYREMWPQVKSEIKQRTSGERLDPYRLQSRAGDDLMLGNALTDVKMALCNQDSPAEALAFFDDVFALFDLKAQPAMLDTFKIDLATVLNRAGREDDAEQIFAETVQNSAEQNRVKLHYACNLTEDGKYRRAEELLLPYLQQPDLKDEVIVHMIDCAMRLYFRSGEQEKCMRLRKLFGQNEQPYNPEQRLYSCGIYEQRKLAHLEGVSEDSATFVHLPRMGTQMSISDAARLLDPTRYRQPAKRSTPKVGRNDPCPCGSGKKYKKCCGR